MEKKEFAESFLGFIKAVQIKFLPDVVEVKLTRSETQAELCYKEYFTYLPKEVQDFMIPLSLKVTELLFKRMGIEAKFNRIERGVEVNIRGSPDVVVAMPLVEILIFGTINMDKAKSLAEAMLKGVETVSSGSVFRNWDDNAKNEVEQAMNKMKRFMRFAGVSTIEELVSFFSEEMFDVMLQQFR